MANGFSDYLEGKILDWIFKKTAMPAAPTNLYLSLHTADPGDTGASELTGGNYSRAQLDPDTNNSTNTNWNAKDTSGTASRITNKLDIAFPQANADWNGGSAIGYFAIWDTNVAGNCLMSGTITGGIVVRNGNTARFMGGTPGQAAFTVD